MYWTPDAFNSALPVEQLDSHEQWARQQRAIVVGRLFTIAGRGLGHVFATSIRGLRRAAGAVAGGFKRYRCRQRQRAAAYQLHGLSDRTLTDIGVARSHIPEVVAGLFDSCGRPQSARATATPAPGAMFDIHADTNGIEPQDWPRAA